MLDDITVDSGDGGDYTEPTYGGYTGPGPDLTTNFVNQGDITNPDAVSIPSSNNTGLNLNGANGGLLGSLASLGSGLYGLSKANNLANMASQAFTASNPFAPYRAQYGAELSALEANPSSIYNDPGYQASFNQGSQAVARQMAAGGFNQSGNEAVALQQYGQSFASTYLQNKETELANLAGANITPNYSSALSGTAAAAGITSQSLASLGYGLTGAFGAISGGASSGTPVAGVSQRFG